ncbi:hypothetical protein MXAN_2458 [Myxococcus xanthus DK 1622]|uniref:DUF1521 domain-containing protein n=1 Tax=Myxococcus xanthus (strain DK1622) TaxID=246197 RepID=Q1D9J5_MYXXD|nr:MULTISPECIES: DUF1521 domain-containing protein [Myxococcus]ABF92166.1 hypothetical protein MXAN_2458 [Myxococcus xanthus DK 1622]NOJ53824.1 DUF1521 domain-containing protein [Myxococcus xanthus]QPM81975.1 DUF1521 domain-containing protein [Myxococcus xanthus]QVW71224.1 DUF1521 domain-containing protein [Myxococcus xanthus DZ2]QZZ50184.1 hypothetical protein MyxoNM_13320 [Myxococcus xanthus]
MSNGIGGVGGNRQLTTTQGVGNVNTSTIARNAQLIESTLNLVEKAVDLAGKAVNVAGKAVDQMSQAAAPTKQAGATGTNAAFPAERPNPLDAVREANSLKVEEGTGKITTPGGYTIEQLGQFEWRVTGPDGKNTRVWGDPHVDESDGGKFDFKRDTSFVLGDGTRINCSCKPWGNGMTVTGQLDVVYGDSHVRVTDIDKGKGKVGQVTNKGMDEVVRFHSNQSADVFHMGQNAADWTFHGKEIVGHENGGDVHKVGEAVITERRTMAFNYSAAADSPAAGEVAQNWDMNTNLPQVKPLPWDMSSAKPELNKLNETFDSISKVFDQLKNTNANGFNPFRKADDLFGAYDKNQHKSGLTQSFKALGDMFGTLEKLSKLNDMVRFRGPQSF